MILLQTSETLFRPFVLAEVYTALSLGIPIVTVQITDKGYEFSKASALLGASDFPARLEAANQGSVAALQGIDVADMGRVLNERIPMLVSKEFKLSLGRQNACSGSGRNR